MTTKLYLDVDGVVLRRTGTVTARGSTEFEIANGALAFLSWCVENFDCRWLTARSHEGEIAEVERAFRHAVRSRDMSEQEYAELKVLVGGIPVARWGAMKAEAFVEEESFIWVDDNPDERSLDWLARRGLGDRLVVASTDQDPTNLTSIWVVLGDCATAD